MALCLIRFLLLLKQTHHSTAQHSTARHSTAQHWHSSMNCTASSASAQHSTAQHSTAQHSTAQHSTVQHSAAQHSTAYSSCHTCMHCMAAMLSSFIAAAVNTASLYIKLIHEIDCWPLHDAQDFSTQQFTLNFHTKAPQSQAHMIGTAGI